MATASTSTPGQRPGLRLVGAVGLALALATPGCGGGASQRGSDRGAGRLDGRSLSLTLTLVDGGELIVPRRPTVLHFFATWSLASQGDVGELIDLHAARGDRVDVIGIGLDPDGYQLIAPWKRASEVTYLVAESTPAMREGKSPVGPILQVPTTLILDARGRVLHRIERPLRPGELAQLVPGS